MAGYHLLILGPPGAGKGTQSDQLAETYDITHITTGDALRANKDMETEYGTPRSFMEAGELVPDAVVNEIVEAALEEADGYILDGYPRNLSQAEYLDEITDIDLVIHLNVSETAVVERLTGRRVCDDCGENYHVEFAPPETEGICDSCGGELIQRDDDTEETVKERLRVYAENTEPLIEFYEDRDLLTTVDGDGTPDAVTEALEDAIDHELA